MCSQSVRVERGEERVLERRVLGRLLEVAVHLAGGGVTGDSRDLFWLKVNGK